MTKLDNILCQIEISDIYIYIKNQLLKFYKTFRDLGNIALGLAMTATCGTGKVSWHHLKILVNEHHKNIWYHHSTSPSPLTGAPDRHVSYFWNKYNNFLESSLKWKLLFSLAVHTEQQQFSVLTTMRGPGFEIFIYTLKPSWQNDHQQIEEKKLCQAIPEGRLWHQPPLGSRPWSVVV